ncbi:DUF2799 domain-containing protein [Photobacterium makurazakiensis]|uniref:DUF2799 domain-containing protein n=1 Tax=Photobacterium makurazakiensis TaxID=2910234 RepID=UPI003D11590D
MGVNNKLMIVSITLLLAGCSSTIALNEGETWEQFGYDLAMRGSQMLDGQHLEPAELQEYRKGYIAGLKSFCNQDGYDVGQSGIFYQGTCDKINPDFAEQYNIGWVDSEINQLNYDNELGTYMPTEESYDY